MPTVRMMNSRFLLSLLTSKNQRRKNCRTSATEGFSFAAVLVVILIVLSGSLALAIRGGSGSLASAYQSQTREARAAAESGATRIIAELNKLPNRRMLVSGRPLTGATNSWQNPRTSSGVVDAQQQNPCTTLAPTGTAGAFSNGAWNNVAGDSSRQYRLLSVTYRNSNRTRSISFGTPSASTVPPSTSPAFNNNNNSAINLTLTQAQALGLQPRTDYGFIELEVEGIARRGSAVNTAKIRKEFEVLPKCCNRSFMGPGLTIDSNGQRGLTGAHGSDGFDCSYSLPGHLSLAVFEDGVKSASGSIILEGVSFSQVDPPAFSYSTMPSITCFVTSSGYCDDDVTSVNGVQVVPIVVGTDVTSFGSVTWSDFTPEPVAAPPIDEILDDTTDYPSLYLQLNSAGDGIVACELDNLSLCINPPEPFESSSGSAYCGRRNLPLGNFHCRMTSISMDNSRKLIINTADRDGNPDTAIGRIVLYFLDSPSPGSGAINILTPDGLQHVKCPYSATGPCNTKPLDSEFDHLYIRGNLASNQLSMSGNSSPLHIRIFLRNGEIRLSGTTNLVGALWSRSLRLDGGSITFRGISPFPPGLSGVSGQPVFDWMARSVTRTQYYGN